MNICSIFSAKDFKVFIFSFYFGEDETDYRPSISCHSKKIKQDVFRKVCLSRIDTYVLLEVILYF